MNDDGFEIFQGVVSNDEIVRLSGALDNSGPRHLMRFPAVAALAKGQGLVDIASGWLSSKAIPFRATLFDKSGLRNWFVAWHQDATLPLESRVESPEWGPWSVKAGVLHARAPAWAMERIVALRVHVDESTLDNGPLRVIPGSHRRGVLTTDEILTLAREGTTVDCLAKRGGVVAMRPLLIHASSKAESESPRRVLHIEYASSLDLAPGIRLAMDGSMT